ncbi:MAG: helix-turn-helix transcriptional regulator [Candidatus Angelobacter sp.]
MNVATSPLNDQRILHCWKEIADYLSAGVRTVQRWETEFALPVRRPRGAKRSAVLAFTSEIDQWVKALPAIAQTSESDMDMRQSSGVTGSHSGFRMDPAIRIDKFEPYSNS